MTDKEENKQTDLEAQAVDKGWRPKEEWEGEPHLWVDAGEFIRRGELMDRISDQTKQLRTTQQEMDNLKQDFKSLAEHNKKIAQTEYDKAMKSLKSQKIDALDAGESEKVVEIDEKIDELKQAGKELDPDTDKAPNGPTSQQIPQEVLDWEKRNEWYSNDIIMQGAADKLIQDYVSRNPYDQGNFGKILTYVEGQIKQRFPDEFEDQGRHRPGGTVDTGSRGAQPKGKGKTKYTVKDLSPEQKRVVQRVVNTGVMTEQEYVDQLVELGEVQ